MRRLTGKIDVLAAALCALALLPMAAGAVTPAGTRITAAGTAQFYSTSGDLMPTVTSNAVVTTVAQAAGVGISPIAASMEAVAGARTEFPFTLTNAGNASDSLALSTSALSGSAVTIYKDDNGDGVRQSTEVTAITSVSGLGASAEYRGIVSAMLPQGVTSDTVTLTAVSGYDSTKAASAKYIVQSSTLSPYVMSWLINGYYSNSDKATRLSADYIKGETSASPLPGSKAANGTAWVQADSPTKLIDLASLMNKPTSCAGYAFTYVYSPVAQKVNIWMGSDDGIKVWLNGSVVWTNDAYRGCTDGQDRTTVNLNQGWNRLMAKISNGSYGWRFILKLCDSSGNAVTGLQYSVQPPTADSTAPVISGAQTTSVGATSVTVEWDTDEPATTLADYGTTSALGSAYQNTAAVTHHTAVLEGLTPGTAYSIKVGSADASGNTAWAGPYSFTTARIVTSGPYVTSWLINGYYSNSDKATRLSTDYIKGESAASPLDGSAAANGKLWAMVDFPANLIDLGALMNKPVSCAGYAFTYVYSPVAQKVNMWMGSDDGIKVWLNGSVVWTNDTYRGCTDGQDRTTVNLSQGWNRLMAKISNGSYGWRFILKLCDSSGNAVPGLQYSPAK